MLVAALPLQYVPDTSPAEHAVEQDVGLEVSHRKRSRLRTVRGCNARPAFPDRFHLSLCVCVPPSRLLRPCSSVLPVPSAAPLFSATLSHLVVPPPSPHQLPSPLKALVDVRVLQQEGRLPRFRSAPPSRTPPGVRPRNEALREEVSGTQVRRHRQGPIERRERRTDRRTDGPDGRPHLKQRLYLSGVGEHDGGRECQCKRCRLCRRS